LFFPVGILVLLLILPSCATVDYVPPGQGTSAEQQAALAKSLEENMKKILFDPAGKAVDLHVQVLGGLQNSLGLERYVKSLFREWVVEKGGKVGPGEFRMDVFLPVLGTTATRRDLSYQNIPELPEYPPVLQRAVSDHGTVDCRGPECRRNYGVPLAGRTKRG